MRNRLRHGARLLHALHQRRGRDAIAANGDHLRRVIPFIDGGCDIQPLIALQADQRASRRSGPGFGLVTVQEADSTFPQRSGNLAG